MLALIMSREKTLLTRSFFGIWAFNNPSISRLRVNGMSSISERIKMVRETLNLSQAEFAKKLRITRGHVSNLETGRSEPSDQLTFLICEVFMIDEGWLFEGEGNMYPAAHLDATERARQKMRYGILRDRVEIFLMLYKWMPSLLEDILKHANDLDPDLCPPELLESMRDILKIPYGDLFRLVRERFLAWKGDELFGLPLRE
ncbi:MAG: helix-turn-helix domain-containing protein [Syntrophobacteraceae bacterium]